MDIIPNFIKNINTITNNREFDDVIEELNIECIKLLSQLRLQLLEPFYFNYIYNEIKINNNINIYDIYRIFYEQSPLLDNKNINDETEYYCDWNFLVPVLHFDNKSDYYNIVLWDLAICIDESLDVNDKIDIYKTVYKYCNKNNFKNFIDHLGFLDDECLTMLNGCTENLIQYNKLVETQTKYIKELEEKNKLLELELAHHKYKPYGDGYYDAKDNFESLKKLKK